MKRNLFFFSFLLQRLSIAIQLGNAASILGTMKLDSNVDEFWCELLSRRVRIMHWLCAFIHVINFFFLCYLTVSE